MCSEYLMNYEITKNRHSENSPRREPGHEGSGAVNEACVTFLLNKFCFDFCCMVLHRGHILGGNSVHFQADLVFFLF